MLRFSTSPSAFRLLIGLALAIGYHAAAAGQGFEFAPGQFTKNSQYGRSYAIVVGINYEDVKVPEAARSLVPRLKNAENDANALHELLVKLYGYQPDNVKLLVGPAATKEAIVGALDEFKEKIKPTDSLLVFFSGHGARIDNENDERGAIYAANVQFSASANLAASGRLRMHKDLLPLLEACDAKHKLLILDCCHSGEIFSLRARPRSEADDRRGDDLFAVSGSLQAMASCRDQQRASDGIGNNSPFTAALLQGLRRIPSREDSLSTRIGVNRLFMYMRPELRNLPNGQSPDCRLLGNSDDGEFSFFPATTAEAQAEFLRHKTSDKEFQLLQAMVPGGHGNWWFDETPWFVPGLRMMILERAPVQRAGLTSSAIQRQELFSIAEHLHRDLLEDCEKLRNETSKDKVLQFKLYDMRLRQFKYLLSKSPKDFRQNVEKIVEEFSTLDEETKACLTGSDLHLLAVAKHYLFKESEKAEDVEAAYECALKKFDDTSGNQLALKSLCHADYGHFLMFTKRDYKPATDQFRAALALFGSDLYPQAQAMDMMDQPVDMATENMPMTAGGTNGPRRIVSGSAPAAFRVYALCSEAEAWTNLNRWGRTEQLLGMALDVGRDFDSEHELMVFVYNKVGWSYMSQWRIKEAEAFFQKANNVLLQLNRSNAVASDVASTAPKITPGEPAEAPVDRRRTDARNLLDSDYNALVRYLHHLHGIAMAKRFRGEEQEAIRDYRLIIQITAESMTRLRHEKDENTRAATDAEHRLVERLVNSQERLADCNLFGNPARRDLGEAADDYRRALQACDSLPAVKTRTQTRMTLLYRLAIALSLDSPAQDIELAREYCKAAQEIRAGQKLSPLDRQVTLGDIAEAIVAVYQEQASLRAPAKDQEVDQERPVFHKEAARELAVREARSTGGKELESLKELRSTIRRIRDEFNGNLHREQLELLLLATSVLTKEVPDTNRFQLTEDSELLLYLCRLVLPKSAGEEHFNYRRQEASHYLHPYFDQALLAKLRMKPKHVKELLEIQWEATRGEYFTKLQFSAPVLAVYLLEKENRIYLFLDIPGGTSKFYSLEGEYVVSAVKEFSKNPVARLPLPEDLQSDLRQLRSVEKLPDAEGTTKSITGSSSRLQLRWIDPLRSLNYPQTLLAAKEGANPSEARLLPNSGAFPFTLPQGIETEVSLPPAFPKGQFDVRKIAELK